MEDYDNQDVRFDMTKPKPAGKRSTVKLIIILLLVLGALGYCGKIYHQIVFAPLDVKNATTSQAISWFALRDLSAESEETREKLFDFYFQKAVEVENGEFVVDENDSFEIPSNLQGIVGSFLRGADKKVKTWDEKRERPPFWRVDYSIKRDGAHGSSYVVSSDIIPGPSLEKRWQERQVAVARGTVKKSNLERNIQMMFMQWFIKRYTLYDATPDDQKKEYLERCSAELSALQGAYDRLRVSCGRPTLDRVHKLREFERMNESWGEFASLEELARATWFKDLVITVTILRELGVDESSLYPPSFAENRDADEASCPAKRALNSVKSYFFVQEE